MLVLPVPRSPNSSNYEARSRSAQQVNSSISLLQSGSRVSEEQAHRGSHVVYAGSDASLVPPL